MYDAWGGGCPWCHRVSLRSHCHGSLTHGKLGNSSAVCSPAIIVYFVSLSIKLFGGPVSEAEEGYVEDRDTICSVKDLKTRSKLKTFI